MVKKIVLIVLGGILLLGGLLSAIGGGAVLAAVGSDAEFRSATHPLRTPSTALVSGVAEFSGLSEAEPWVDLPTLLIDAESDDEVFVGVGRAADVDAYLAGAPIAVVRDFDLSPYRLDLVERSGDGTPAPPADQTFWLASDSGTDVSLEWDVQDGDFRVVLMNADGTRSIDASGRLGIQVPFVGPIAIAFLVAGIVFFIAGIVLLVMGLRAKSS